MVSQFMIKLELFHLKYGSQRILHFERILG